MKEYWIYFKLMETKKGINMKGEKLQYKPKALPMCACTHTHTEIPFSVKTIIHNNNIIIMIFMH